MSDSGPDTLFDGIAIIGMAGRFPGARNLEEFWRNLRGGVESVSFFTREELVAAGVPPALIDDPDFVPAKAALEGADAFDAEFFGYLPSDVEMMDPQQRLFLECAWSALEDAGYDPLAAPGAVGVFGGMGESSYLARLRRIDPEGRRFGGYALRLGTDKDYVATRVAYKLNLRGPSLTVQTACSTSLVAVAQACQSLMAYACDMALAGGAGISVPLHGGHLHQEGGIFSPDGHCRAFDEAAGGTVNGDGVGVVVLKRVSEAMADGNTIHAVIRGFALNNDGFAKVGFTAPSPDGQAEVVASALAMAGVEADSISYVEAHGTGTPLGDPIEIAGLTKAYRTQTDRVGFCAIGSVKTNIGHTDTAAGVAGLIKTVLALRHGELPPSLHYSKPNPATHLSTSPFFVNDRLRPWVTDGRPRRAGVSAFGLGGTNAHVVLEEAPALPAQPSAGDWHVLPVSARTGDAVDQLARALSTTVGAASYPMADMAFTLQMGRHAFAHRRVVVARQHDEAAAALLSPLAITGEAAAAPLPVAFLFPGGGTQYPDMARGLYDAAPSFRQDLDECLNIINGAHGIDLRRWLHPTEADRDRAATELEGPTASILSIFSVEYALARLWIAWGVRPSALTGHSLGEYAAACLSGVLTLRDAIRVVAARGRIFERMPRGAMLSVLLPEANVLPHLSARLSIAAVNGPGAVVVSGPVDDVAALEARLDGDGVETQRVRISVAAHSAMLDPFLAEFRDTLRAVRFAPPTIPFISNLSGRWITNEEATDPEYWVRHLRQPVRFSDGLATLLAREDQACLEVGPGRTLSTLLRQQPRSPRVATSSLRHPAEQIEDVPFLLTSVGRLWTAGVPVDWKALHGDAARRRVSLPTYPFARTRFWPSASDVPAREADVVPASAAAVAPVAPLPPPPALASRTPAPTVRPMTIPSDRKTRILVEMSRLLHELSGRPLTDAEHASSFLDLGFDSLFLGQASLAFQKTFGVKLRFRDFMEVAPTPLALAALLDSKMPADKFAAPAPAPAAPVPAPDVLPAVSPIRAASTSALLAPGVDAGAIERIVAQQLQAVLEVTRQQLAALGAGGTAPVVPVTSAPVTSVSATVVNAASAGSPLPADVRSSTSAIKVFAQAIVNDPSGITWAPVESGPDRGLTPRQQAALDTIITAYCAKTARSKAMTEEMREYLADPRAIVGFAPLWKETVYQIVSERSLGSRVWDVDGNEWIDVTLGFGSSAYGHSPDFIMTAMREQLEKGIELGTQSRLAAETARLFREITGHERVCFCTAGTEAVMGAMRLARAHTGRDRVAMFVGDTHGRLDEVLGRPVVTDDQYSALPAAAGIAPHAVKPTLFLEYGNPKSLDIIERYADELAAVLVEPVRTRSPDLQPIEFLRRLRELTRERGITFIMDEVVTGFRVHLGGAQQLLGIDPDLSTWGKAVAAGMPVGVISGKAEYMDALDGGMWHYGDDSVPEARMTNFGGAGTFAKHPLSMAAALATMQYLKAQGPALQDRTAAKTERMVTTLNRYFRERQLPIHLEWFRTFFVPRVLGDRRFEPLFFVYLRNEGIHAYVDYPCFICTAHSEADIDAIIGAFMRAVDGMRQGGFLSVPASVPPSPVSDPSRSAAGELVGAGSGTGARAPALRRQAGGSASSDSLTLPLTQGQAEIWLAATRGDQGGAAFTQSVSLHLRGALDVAALTWAVNDVVERHEALRVTVDPQGRFQTIHDRMVITLPVVDHSTEGDDPEEKWREFLADETVRPFDLSSGPLVRFTLIRQAAQVHTLVISVFHLVCDGWSLGMVCRDVAVLYSAAVEQRPHGLPAPMPFRDYVRWRAEPDQVADEARSVAYWLDMYRDSVPVLDLPTSGPRPPVKTYNADRQSFHLDIAATAELRRAAKRHGCTLFAATLAAFTLLLHRLSGQDDVVVGLAAAGQAAVGDDNLIGHCVSLLPYRSRVGNETLAAFLQATKSGVMDAYDNQSCSYGDILEQLKVPRERGRLPLVSAIMTHETETAGITFSGLAQTLSANAVPYCNFEVELYLTESSAGVDMTLVHNRDLFDHATVTRWMGHFRELLAAVSAREGADRHVADLPWLSASERHQILEQWNHTDTAGPPAGGTLVDRLEAQAARTPSATAVIDGATRWTYADLHQRANQLANYLRQLGVGPDSLTAVCLPRSGDLVVATLAVLKAGGAYVPLDPAYPADRLAAILADAQAGVVVTTEALLATLPASSARTMCIDRDRAAIQAAATTAPAAGLSDRHLAYVLFTSGSTGRPKGVAIEHRAITTFVDWARSVFSPSELAGVLFGTSICFDLSAFELFVPLSAGGAVVVAGTALDLPALPARSEVTLVNTVPSAMAELVRVDGVPETVRTINLAGEPLPESLVDALARVLPSTIVYNLYGPTETTTYSTFTRVVRGEKVTIGRPIAHTRVYVLDPRGQPAPPGVAGELFIGGRGVARGYYGRADLTAERFVADPFVTDSAARMYRTGDLCRWRSDGVLEYLGRLDRQVKIRGFRIELPEIEAVLGRQPEVRACTVVAREDVPGDKRLVAYAESTRPDVDAWRAALAKALPDYMVPSAIVTLDRLPLTPNGKVDQKRLPPPTNVAVSAASASTALASDTERRLAAIWQTLLSVPTVSRTDGFFALGGHSLLAMRLVHEVHEQFGVALAPVALLQHQVLADLATAIDGMRQTSTREVLVQIAPGGGGTPFFWVHGIGGEVFSYLQLSRHLGRSRPVYGFAADWSQIGQGQPVTLETIAGCYVERLKQAQPVGPYHLGGFCAATLLALEIARQLEARGDQVGVLVGIDGNVLSESDDALRPKSPLLAFLRNLPRWFVEDARPSGAADMFGRIRSGWHRLQARIRRQPRAGAAGAQGPNDIRDVLGMWRFPDHQRPMLEVHHRAIRAYHPRPCQAHVLLLLPRTAPVLGPWPTGYDPEWDRLALGGLTVREVRGSHSTMLGDPFALELSVAIDRCIDQIEARRQPTAGRAGSQVSALRTSIHPSTAL